MNGYTFPELFMKQVMAHSSKTAITDPAAGRQMTYAELDLYSGRIAAKMRKNGVVHGDIVVLVMPNSLDEVAAMLAAMKLGAAFVPLNPSYPEERLNYIYKDCSAKLVVTHDFFTDIKDYSVIENEGSVSGDDIAMLIYTSGSTGHPKGVVINQNAVCESIDPIVCEADVFGLGAPFYFIAGCWTLFE
jgi:acyl-CoA synthetase (AMP-forming)/AMP-acid ligase II